MTGAVHGKELVLLLGVRQLRLELCGRVLEQDLGRPEFAF